MKTKANVNGKAILDIDLYVNDDDLSEYLQQINKLESQLVSIRSTVEKISSLKLRLSNNKKHQTIKNKEKATDSNGNEQ